MDNLLHRAVLHFLLQNLSITIFHLLYLRKKKISIFLFLFEGYASTRHPQKMINNVLRLTIASVTSHPLWLAVRREDKRKPVHPHREPIVRTITVRYGREQACVHLRNRMNEPAPPAVRYGVCNEIVTRFGELGREARRGVRTRR